MKEQKVEKKDRDWTKKLRGKSKEERGEKIWVSLETTRHKISGYFLLFVIPYSFCPNRAYDNLLSLPTETALQYHCFYLLARHQ